MTAMDTLRTSLADRYHIERELGQGGMATVYLADDLKHHRKVAIKVLRPELAAVIGAERFVREIRTIAALQHPHILGLIDSGEVLGTAYYVMPFVEGESLRDRLTREKQLSIADAVRIATEVASALDYAHRHGVIHRDIKPENILLHDGQALVADFGIALAAASGGGTRMTETGMSLGTPTYMSPEQAMGEREITARSDIYALGCVTYEMLVGEPPFTGPTAQAIVAKMMTEEPRSLILQRKTVPPQVEEAVLTALQKLPADRFGTAAEYTAALSGNPTTARRITSMGRASQPPRRRAGLYAALAVIAAIAAWGWFRPGKSVHNVTTMRLDLALPDSAPIEFVGEAPVGVGQTALALSPDGQSLVYVGGAVGRPRLYLRRLDRFETTPIAGTEGAYGPFFSPDGVWIGFMADNQLKKVPLGGGPVSVLADAPLSTGAAWSEQGTIAFLSQSGAAFVQVSADGGPAVPVANSALGYSKTVSYLPGGHWLLSTVKLAEGFTILAVRSMPGGETRILVRKGIARSWQDSTPIPEDALIGTTPRYGDGMLIYTREDGTLLAVGFDAERLETHGEPVTIALGVRRESWTTHSQATLAGDGTLAYVPGANSDVGVLAWLNRTGRLDTLPFPPAQSLESDVAPDGTRLAVVIPAISGTLELWVYDLQSRERQRLLTGLCSSEIRWSADARGIFACLSSVGLVRINPARPGQVDTVSRSRFNPSSASRDGRLLLMDSSVDSTFVLSLNGKSTPQELRVSTSDGAYQPAFSPDGKWIVYLGRNGGVFLEPYPITGEVYRVSGQLEGDVPSWSPSGDEIFFPSGSQLYVAGFHRGSPPRFDSPRLIAPQRLTNMTGRPYAMAPDGKRFLIKVPTTEHSARSIRLVLNPFATVARR
ncbi:MAG TPA: protein kinase [Gemmatimonadales bacterium]